MDNHEKIEAPSKALTKYYSYVHSVGGENMCVVHLSKHFWKDTKADTYPVLLRTRCQASTRLVFAVNLALLEFKNIYRYSLKKQIIRSGELVQ